MMKSLSIALLILRAVASEGLNTNDVAKDVRSALDEGSFQVMQQILGKLDLETTLPNTQAYSKFPGTECIHSLSEFHHSHFMTLRTQPSLLPRTMHLGKLITSTFSLITKAESRY